VAARAAALAAARAAAAKKASKRRQQQPRRAALRQSADPNAHAIQPSVLEGLSGAVAAASVVAAAVLTEICLCGACSCQEMLRCHGRGQSGAPELPMPVWP
jgi:hypothetical protein